MLTVEQREELRILIREKIVELEKSLESLQEQANPIAPDNAIGRLSRMDSLVNQGTAEMAMVNTRKTLERLRGKLDRIDDANFGRCGKCNQWIPIERLRAAPDRGVCIECLRGK